MARKRKAEPTPEEWAAAKARLLYLVQRTHLDPSLDGGDSDRDPIALFRAEGEAQEYARKLEEGERDPWTAYSVQGPLNLDSLMSRHGFDSSTLRRIIRELQMSGTGAIRI